MTSPGFLRDQAAMTRAVSGFDEAATTAATTMTQMESELRDALSRYQGKQAGAFWGLHGRLQERVQLAVRELQAMSQLVHRSSTNYSSGDEQAATDVASVTPMVDDGPVLGRLAGMA